MKIQKERVEKIKQRNIREREREREEREREREREREFLQWQGFNEWIIQSPAGWVNGPRREGLKDIERLLYIRRISSLTDIVNWS